MKPWKRICINLLLPAPVAGTVFFGYFYFTNRHDGTGTINLSELAFAVSYFIGLSYCFAIIPSAVFTAAMEGLYRIKHFSPASWTAVLISAAGGAISGLAIGLFIMWPDKIPSEYAGTTLTFLTLGTLTGLLTGVAVKYGEKKSSAKILKR